MDTTGIVLVLALNQQKLKLVYTLVTTGFDRVDWLQLSSNRQLLLLLGFHHGTGAVWERPPGPKVTVDRFESVRVEKKQQECP